MGLGNVEKYDGKGKRTFTSPSVSAPVSNTLNQQGSAPSDGRNITTKVDLPPRKTDSFSSSASTSGGGISTTGGI
jgi:hypothetical protein